MSLSGYGQVSNDEGEGGAAIRERILAGVDRLFHAQGIKSVGVDAIAATLGISKKTLYRHFPSRDDLVIGYLRGRFRPLPEAFTKPPLEQILANLEWIARFLTNARDFRGCAFLNALAELGSEDSEGVDWPLLTGTGGGCGTVTCCPSSTSVTSILWRRSWRCSSMGPLCGGPDPPRPRHDAAINCCHPHTAQGCRGGDLDRRSEICSYRSGIVRWCLSAPALHGSCCQDP